MRPDSKVTEKATKAEMQNMPYCLNLDYILKYNSAGLEQ